MALATGVRDDASPCDGLRDRVARAVVERYDALPGRGKPQGCAWTVLAGIVAEHRVDEGLAEAGGPAGGAASGLRVVALATGTRCLGVASTASGCGRLLHDCHAEVLCRRAFQRHLLSEIRVGEPGPGGLLQRAEVNAPLWRLRPRVRLHFYVSALPCGECALVPFSESGADGERLLDRNRTGAPPSSGMPADPKGEGIGFHRGGVLRFKSGRNDLPPDARSVCYSCSEKICRWNHVGWQGALLARLVPQPLVMTTLAVGGPLFDASFVRSALVARAGAPPEGLAVPACLHTRVPFHSSREAVEDLSPAHAGNKLSTSGLSIVWGAMVSGEDETAFRSISRAVPGFYDVLIGRTGERQGKRADRQGAQRKPNADVGSAQEVPDSWVSPLCKRLLAEDTVMTLEQVLGSWEAVGNWLREGERDSLSEASCGEATAPAAAPAAAAGPCKRRRLPEEPGSQAHGLQQPPDVPDADVLTYARLKEATAGAGYRARRRRFHASEPFAHWRRKRSQDLCGAATDAVATVDSFRIAVPEPLRSPLRPPPRSPPRARLVAGAETAGV